MCILALGLIRADRVSKRATFVPLHGAKEEIEHKGHKQAIKQASKRREEAFAPSNPSIVRR